MSENLVHIAIWLSNLRIFLVGVRITTPMTTFMMLMLYHLTTPTLAHLLESLLMYHQLEVRVPGDQTQGVELQVAEELTRLH